MCDECLRPEFTTVGEYATEYVIRHGIPPELREKLTANTERVLAEIRGDADEHV